MGTSFRQSHRMHFDACRSALVERINFSETAHPATFDNYTAFYKIYIFLSALGPHTVGQRAFRDFLRSEYSEENILFWLACEDLKRETCPELIEEKVRIIYENYISILSPKEVSFQEVPTRMSNFVATCFRWALSTQDKAKICIHTSY
ncbi:unnamed protein product [Schistocephalus solidus]|uniref:RGS domain-containing protein n=1 Tax=Schistocephalus solidus TaxID=70667 RepID=A0A183TI79_SCHSO|nr:unnamed protein product [Schistocephalus solidus]